jgi:hypothetical protein
VRTLSHRPETGTALMVYGFRNLLKVAGVNVVRAWRQQAGTLLIIFVILATLTSIYGAVSPVGSTTNDPITGAVMWFALDGFLSWRIWRHRSKGARDFLLAWYGLSLLLVIRAVVRWSPYLLGAWALIVVQFVLLVSPAIRNHVRAKSS